MGLAIADAFYTAGLNVAVVDINGELCQSYEREHDKQRCLAVQCDITKEESVNDLFSKVIGKFTTIDVLVNSAGVMDRFDPVGTLDKDLWDRVLAVNLTAPMMMTKGAISHMLEQNIEGSIINIGSLASIKGWSAGDNLPLLHMLDPRHQSPYTNVSDRCRVHSQQARPPRID